MAEISSKTGHATQTLHLNVTLMNTTDMRGKELTKPLKKKINLTRFFLVNDHKIEL